MVQDMYDEEYFVQVLKPLQPTGEELDSAIFYKYYTELSEEQMKLY